MDHRPNIRTKIIKVYKSYNSTIKKNAIKKQAKALNAISATKIYK